LHFKNLGIHVHGVILIYEQTGASTTESDKLQEEEVRSLQPAPTEEEAKVEAPLWLSYSERSS